MASITELRGGFSCVGGVVGLAQPIMVSVKHSAKKYCKDFILYV